MRTLTSPCFIFGHDSAPAYDLDLGDVGRGSERQ